VVKGNLGPHAAHTNDQPTLWASIPPPELPRLSAEWARVDVLLGDQRFFAPIRTHQEPLEPDRGGGDVDALPDGAPAQVVLVIELFLLTSSGSPCQPGGASRRFRGRA
jgi:hypothetical protein